MSGVRPSHDAPIYNRMLNLITTYYNNRTLLSRFIEKNYLPLKEVFPTMKLIVVDDGSLIEPAYDAVKVYDDPDILLYRIPVDYGFNSHGARNLAMHVTDSDWNLLLDLDVIIEPEFTQSALKLMKSVPDEMTAYYCPIVYDIRGFVVPALRLINHFIINKKLFWSVNGYDEEYRGYNFGDGDFTESIASVGNVNLSMGLKIDIIDAYNFRPEDRLHRTEFIEIEKVVRKRMMNKEFHTKKVLNFEWIRQI